LPLLRGCGGKSNSSRWVEEGFFLDADLAMDFYMGSLRIICDRICHARFVKVTINAPLALRFGNQTGIRRLVCVRTELGDRTRGRGE
jgi:hypothetical protein